MQLQHRGGLVPHDEIELTSYVRYVMYLLGWESVGRPETRIVIPSDLRVLAVEANAARAQASTEA